MTGWKWLLAQGARGAGRWQRAVAGVVAGLALGSGAWAAELKVATWNLGWHLDRELARQWMQACGQPFALDPATGLWKPAAQGTQSGWSLKWGRNAAIEWDIGTLPPCDVYQASFKTVEVTEAAYAQRVRQIGRVLRERVDADVIAFQEVSGRRAVEELLGDAAPDWEVCSYEGHKVQRLAIAWKRSLGALRRCEAYGPLSLPQRPLREQPRPGLALTLQVQGQTLRIMTLHLKSSCVSPLEGARAAGRGQLEGEEPNCQVLQQQVAPLEAWVEEQTAGADAVVLLGDFNRNLAHEANEPASAPVRTPGQPIEAHGPGVKVRNLWREVNDGVPASSRLTLLKADCDAAVDPAGWCAASAQRPLTREESVQLASPSGLGCRNPVGLDHIVLAGRVQAPEGAQKIPLGLFGRTSPADAQGRGPLLAVSDHCPLVARLMLP